MHIHLLAMKKTRILLSLLSWHLVQSRITLNGSAIGPTFDGIGGLSGGGATSRLLIDYQEPYRSQILDLLFKPKFGASIQLLKHEIGGDTFSGCGTEPSHQHYRDDLSYSRGYEWFLMVEAQKRNPSIVGYGLPWGYPAWIGNDGDDQGQAHLLGQEQADYVTKWAEGAEKVYNHTIAYMGIWNERSWSPDYVKLLRTTLDQAGFSHTRLVVADNAIGSEDVIADQMTADAEFEKAVDIIGVHYPTASTSTSKARASGKVLWSSEDSSTYDNEVGGGCWARILNWNYVSGNYTSTIMWNLVSSYYNRLKWYGDSMFNAAEPWSGHYTVLSPVWASAHTTQFTERGWKLLVHGQGAGFLPKGGSYITYVSPDGRDFSIVIETMLLNASECIRNNPTKAWNVSPQNITFELVDLPTVSSLSVWRSVLFGRTTFAFRPEADAIVRNSRVTVYVEPNSQLTLSTTRGQVKGSFADTPSSEPFPESYSDDFDSYANESNPKYFSDMCGSFQIAPRANTSASNDNMAFQQYVRHSPSVHGSGWGPQDSAYPLSLLGRWNSTAQSVTASFYLSEVTTEGGGDPLLSLRACNASDPTQRWIYNTTEFYENSLMNQGTTNCMDVYKSPPYPVWMWPCASMEAPAFHPVSRRRLLQSVDNQQWTFNDVKQLVASGYNQECLSSSTLTLETCSSSPSPEQQWEFDTSTGLVRSGTGACLSSRRPSTSGLNETKAIIGLRVGGSLSSDPSSPPGVVQAYNSDWYDYGYFVHLMANGTVAVMQGQTILAQVNAAIKLRAWHRVSVNITAQAEMSVILNGSTLLTVKDWTHASNLQRGFISLGTGWHQAQFDDVEVSM
eukprot:TRINITY_DN12302_c0_g5_i1.p1 TRINITY_DN12302_c0_g5~~TRINITY_DN12302_c0_g5_i1.p1  ORF type:complete len:844 (+),score=126.15 TRINITY_DN12302_c0_g5_i1:279-2810(+)